MPYLLSIGLALAGYSVVVWGHYITKHEHVSMWYLLTGKGNRLVPRPPDVAAATAAGVGAAAAEARRRALAGASGVGSVAGDATTWWHEHFG